ncbi:hypothetical protein KP509_02G011400 [Ceratopteris richardii]|nr:hypothetical protein KP509_02G011400 [Ceratopteris richardii]
MPPSHYFRSIAVSLTCIAITSFFVALPKKTPNANILHKRVMLAHCAIIYVTAVVHHEDMDRVLFPLRLAGTTVVGAVCGALALLLPYPRFATSEIHSYTKLAARISSERLRVMTDAFSSVPTSKSMALSQQAKALAKIAESTQSEIASISNDMGWEIKRLPYTSDKLQRVTRALSSLQTNLIGMQLALETELAVSVAPTKQRKLISHVMKDSLLYVSDWVSLALKHISTNINHRSPASHALITDEGNEVLSSFNEALSYMHQQGGYALNAEEFQFIHDHIETCETDDDPHSYGHTPQQDDADSNFSCSDSEMFETICNAAKEQLEHRVASSDTGREETSTIPGERASDDGPRSVSAGSLNMNMVAHMHNRVRSNSQNMDSSVQSPTMGTLLSFADQGAAYFFLFNIKKFVQGMLQLLECSENRNLPPGFIDTSQILKVKVVQQAADLQAQQLQSLSQVKVPGPHPSSTHQHISNSLKVKPIASQRKPLSEPVPRVKTEKKLCKKCSFNPSPPMGKEQKKRFSFQQFALVLKFFTPNSLQLRTAFKASLAMALGGFMGFWFNNKKGYWADITLALGYTGVAKGGSFKVAVLRTLGTVCGSVYGLMVVLLTFNYPTLRLIALVPWVVFTSFIRQSKILGYSGAVSAFTGAIVIIARTNKDSSDEEFTVIRIVEAFLGMASFVLVEILVMPRRAASMVKPEIISGFRKLQEFTSAIFESYYCEHCDLFDECKTMKELKGKEEKLRKSLSTQTALVKEAAEEPRFWFAPFPEKNFMKVVEEQKNILELLHFSVTILEEIKRAGREANISFGRTLQSFLRSTMVMLEERVVPSVFLVARMLEGKIEQVYTTQNAQNGRCVSALSYQVPDCKTNEVNEQKSMESQNLTITDYTKRNGTRHYLFADKPPSQESLFIEAFEKSVMHVAHELAILEGNVGMFPDTSSTEERNNAAFDVYCNTLYLSLGTLAFTMNRLFHHITQLEKVVHELIQEENPWVLIHHCERPKSK